MVGEKYRRWEGDMEALYVYTAGVAGDRFFREIRDNERLMGTYCPECDVTYLPPRLYCETCFSELNEWEEIPNKGRVDAITVAYVDEKGERLTRPKVLAMVRFPGATGGLIHVVDLPEEDVYRGMEVEVVFLPRGLRKGSFLDILHFKAI
ncbi:MAG: Zn-ribbon domain-containing OB-fold protein [Candidatus Thermoplasmatota archaeon]|nr:Zn-ribbon domain-containing OB-fold protein [Candidatus Thermoplasmatota archaeon]